MTFARRAGRPTELADIQGNILRGYGQSLPWVAYLFAAVGAPARWEHARRQLAELADEVADARSWGRGAPRRRLQLAFTYAGLRALRIPTEPFEPFRDFREGMRARAAAQLRDSGESDPSRWPARLSNDAHVLLTLYAADRADRERTCAALQTRLARAGLEPVCIQRADAAADGREAFGFRDGFSQPAVAAPGPRCSRPGGAAPGEAAQRPLLDGLFPRPRDPVTLWRGLRGEWREVRLGEFLLGHRDEDGVVPGAGEPLLHNGTFMVWRKLEQDVAAFEAWAAGQAADRDDAEALKAWVVGRARDGTSLMHAGAGGAPAGSLAAPALGAAPDNTFLYSGDPAGRRCPLGAHVRRAHPRDGLGPRTERTRRNRIIRRGVSYADADGTRGLVFVCFNASINRQFEQIQGHWLAGGDALGLGAQPDFLTGGMGEEPWVTMTVPRDEDPSRRPTRFLRRDRPFVTVRGGYYLFVPGRRALRAMLGAAQPAQSPASSA